MTQTVTIPTTISQETLLKSNPFIPAASQSTQPRMFVPSAPFVPSLDHSHAVINPFLDQSDQALIDDEGMPEPGHVKKQLCKNWLETPGYCRFGTRCLYAHGREELQIEDKLTQAPSRTNDRYKSQNCSLFYRERVCLFGKRCNFRHEHKSFAKLHRHYYTPHLAALLLTHEDVLHQSRADAIESDSSSKRHSSKQLELVDSDADQSTESDTE